MSIIFHQCCAGFYITKSWVTDCSPFVFKCWKLNVTVCSIFMIKNITGQGGQKRQVKQSLFSHLTRCSILTFLWSTGWLNSLTAHWLVLKAANLCSVRSSSMATPGILIPERHCELWNDGHIEYHIETFLRLSHLNLTPLVKAGNCLLKTVLANPSHQQS